MIYFDIISKDTLETWTMDIQVASLVSENKKAIAKEEQDSS